MTQTMQPGYGPQGYGPSPQQGPPPQQYQGGPPPQGYNQQGPPPQQYPQPGYGPQQAPQQNYGPPPNGQQQQVWNQQPQQAPSQPAPQQETGDDSFFTGGMGGTYMSFSDDRWIGVERGGEIVGITEQQQTDANTKQPAFWPDGNKIMIKIVTLQTREQDDKDDRGLRSAWLPASRDITKAVHEALKAGSPNLIRLQIGGWLFITRTGSRQTTQKNGAKGLPAFTYTARYIPPQQQPQHDQFFGQGAPQSGYPTQGAQQLQQAASYVANTPQGQPGPANMPWQQPGAQGQQVNHYAAAPQGQQGWQQPQGAPQQYPQVPSPQQNYGPPGPANPFGGPAQQPVNQSPYPNQGPPPQQQQYPQQ